jgi:hypothetical protein
MQRWSMLHADLEHATAVGGLIPASAGIGTLFVVSTAYTLLARSRGPGSRRAHADPAGGGIVARPSPAQNCTQPTALRIPGGPSMVCDLRLMCYPGTT